MLLGTDNIRGQIFVPIFAPNGGYCLCICVCRRFTAAQKAENQERYTSHKKNQVQSDAI